MEIHRERLYFRNTQIVEFVWEEKESACVVLMRYMCMKSVPAASGKNKEGGGLIKKLEKRVGSRTLSAESVEHGFRSFSPSCGTRGEGLIIRAKLLQPLLDLRPSDFYSFSLESCRFLMLILLLV